MSEETKREPDLKQKIIMVAGACILVIFFTFLAVRSFNTVNLKRYIKLSYSGASGYATPVFEVDQEALVLRLVGTRPSEEALNEAKVFAASLTATSDAKDIANRDSYLVTLSWNEDIASKMGKSLTGQKFQVKAKGIDTGKRINVFEKVMVNMAGLSPDASLVLENRWDDEYLSTLTFVADKYSNIANGDAIQITCQQDRAELGRRGLIAESMTTLYKVENLSSYAKASDVSMSLVEEISKEAQRTIVSETADSTFRMLYKATGNTNYLRDRNTETAGEIEEIGVYYLERKEGTEYSSLAQNRLVLLYSSVISNEEHDEKIYFAFTYPNAYLGTDGAFNLNHENPTKSYTCGNDEEALEASEVSGLSDSYRITKLK